MVGPSLLPYCRCRRIPRCDAGVRSEKGIDDVGPEGFQGGMTLFLDQSPEEIRGHGLRGPFGNQEREFIEAALAIFGIEPRSHRRLGLLADSQLGRRLALSNQLVLLSHGASRPLSSTGTPAVRCAIQAFTSAVTHREVCPSFLGFGKTPSAM